jgi:hypothetical protein
MTVRLYADEFRCAIFEEAPGGGDAGDPNSLMNRPAVNPLGWLSSLYFHSDLDYFGIAARNMNAVVNHAAVPGITRSVVGNVSFLGQAVRAEHVILTHNLGYVPKFFLLYQGRLIPQGIPIQDEGQGKKRFVSAYATTTDIRLWEVGYSDNTTLSAVQATYQVIALRDPAANPVDKQLDIYPGQAIFGRGKFRAGEPHMRLDGQGDIQWPIATGRTAAIRNGGLRAYYPNGGYVDFREYNGALTAPGFYMLAAGV